MKKKSTRNLIIALSVFGLLLTVGIVWWGVGYLRNATTQEYNYSYSDSTSPSSLKMLNSVGSSSGYGEMEESRTSLDDSDTEEMVIKTGSVSVEVKNISETITAVRTLVAKYEGKIMSESDSGEGSDRNVYMTIKVGEDKYLQTYDELKNLEGKLIYSSSSEEDVTEEYIDLSARLKNLQSTETQLTEILKTATSVEDTLAVYSELSSIRGQIESLEGRIQYLEDRADFSTISLRISQSSTGISLNEDKWQPWGVVKEAASALVAFGKGLVNVVIWLVVFSPVVLIPVGIFLVLKKKAKK